MSADQEQGTPVLFQKLLFLKEQTFLNLETQHYVCIAYNVSNLQMTLFLVFRPFGTQMRIHKGLYQFNLVDQGNCKQHHFH